MQELLTIFRLCDPIGVLQLYRPILIPDSGIPLFERVENVLGAGPYFNGDTFGNVDIAWMVLLHRADIIREHTGYDFVAGLPKVRAWQQALMATGLAERSVSGGFERAFTDFYLSEETFLGCGQSGAPAIDNACRTGTCC